MKTLKLTLVAALATGFCQKKLFTLVALVSATMMFCGRIAARESRNVEILDVKGLQFEAQFARNFGLYVGTKRLDFTVGYRFNRKRFLGVGTGFYRQNASCEEDPDNSNGWVTAFPLYVDYTRYFPSRKRCNNSFFLGMEAGPAYYKTQPWKDDSSKFGGIISPKLGFDFSLARKVGLYFGLNFLISYGPSGFGVNLGFRF